MCLGDVVDNLSDGHAPSNASATKESKLPNPLVCRPSTMDPTRRNPEFNAPETTTLMLSRARETSRSLRTKNQRPTKPSSRACQMQPQVHQATGKYSGAHQRARSLRRSEVTDRHGHYRCAVVTHRYLEAPLLGRCLRQSTLHINSHPAGSQGLCNGNARASPGSTLAIHGRDVSTARPVPGQPLSSSNEFHRHRRSDL